MEKNSNVQKTVAYRTKDGQMFDDVHDANLHDSGLTLMNALINKGYRNDGSLKQICLTLTKDFNDFSGLMTRIRNQTNNKQKARK